LYEIHEPLLRISIEIGEHQEGITALFVDFLALFYDEHELWEPERMKPILIDWVVAILGSRHDRLSSSQVEHLKLLLEGIVAQVPEVEVLIQYLNIFKRVVLEKDDNAIYDLSKEQRSFFEKNILHQTR
jgi:hypothetical protein